MTNFEKLKELKDFEAAQVITMLNEHVGSVETLIDVTKTSINRTCKSEIIVTAWLNAPYDDSKGFQFLVSGDYEHVTVNDLGALSRICDFKSSVDALLNKYMPCDEEFD